MISHNKSAAYSS